VTLEVPPLVRERQRRPADGFDREPDDRGDHVKSVHIFNEKNPQPHVISVIPWATRRAGEHIDAFIFNRLGGPSFLQGGQVLFGGARELPGGKKNLEEKRDGGHRFFPFLEKSGEFPAGKKKFSNRSTSRALLEENLR